MVLLEHFNHDPELLIFDEATSSMDLNFEERFIDAIHNLDLQKTAIIVSRRLAALKHCEKIYHMENQKIKLKK